MDGINSLEYSDLIDGDNADILEIQLNFMAISTLLSGRGFRTVTLLDIGLACEFVDPILSLGQINLITNFLKRLLFLYLSVTTSKHR